MNNKALIKSATVLLIYFSWLLILQNMKAFQSLFLSIFSLLLTFITLIILFLIYKDELIDEFKNLSKKYIKYVVINIFSIIFIMSLSNAISYAFLKDKLILNSNNDILSFAYSKDVFNMIRLIILSPFMEEVVFRKNIRVIVKNDIYFILFSGLILGTLYIVSEGFTIIGIISSLSYILVGFMLSYSYTKTNNIYINIISRILYNLLVVVLVL